MGNPCAVRHSANAMPAEDLLGLRFYGLGSFESVSATIKPVPAL